MKTPFNACVWSFAFFGLRTSRATGLCVGDAFLLRPGMIYAPVVEGRVVFREYTLDFAVIISLSLVYLFSPIYDYDDDKWNGSEKQADSQGYDPKRSRVNDDTMMDFIRGTVTGDIQDIPGIGPAAAKKLAAGEGDDKVTNTYQLIGKVRGALRIACGTFRPF